MPRTREQSWRIEVAGGWADFWREAEPAQARARRAVDRLTCLMRELKRQMQREIDHDWKRQAAAAARLCTYIVRT